MEKFLIVSLSVAFISFVSAQVDPLYGGKSANPGAKLGLNRKLFDYINLRASHAFNEVIRNVTAPPFPVAAPNGEVFMSGLTVVHFVPPKYDYMLIKPNAFRWKLSQGQISLSTRLRHTIFTPNRTSVNGTMIMTSGNMEITTLNAVGRNAEGKPYVYVLQCTTRFDQFNLTFKDVSLFSVLSSVAPKVIIDYAQQWIENLFCSVMRAFMTTDVNRYLRTFVNRPLLGANFKPTKDQELFIDYSLIQSPSVGFDFDLMDVPLKGAAINRRFSYTPFFPHDFDGLRSKQMIDFYLSDYTVNSLAYVAQQLDLVNFKADPKSMNNSNAARMQMQCHSTNDCVGSLFPNATFPVGSMAVMRFKATEAPKLVFNSHGANWSAKGSARFELSSSSIPYPKNVILTLNVPHVAGFLNPKVRQNTIFASINVTSITFEIKNVENAFGKFDSSKMPQLSNIVASIVEEVLNTYLAVGLPVPLTSGVTLTNPQWQLLKRSLIVSSDLVYSSNDDESFVDKILPFEVPPFIIS